jgi:hypothetical protein
MRRGIEMMAKSTTAKNGNERVTTNRIMLSIWSTLITVSDGIVTNARSLRTKNACLKELIDPCDKPLIFRLSSIF